MPTILWSVAALLIGVGMLNAQHQYPTAEVPTSELAYLAKVKTAAPEPVVSKATIIMMQEGKPRSCKPGATGLPVWSALTAPRYAPTRTPWSG